jgi:hypothetical protein
MILKRLCPILSSASRLKAVYTLKHICIEVQKAEILLGCKMFSYVSIVILLKLLVIVFEYPKKLEKFRSNVRNVTYLFHGAGYHLKS